MNNNYYYLMTNLLSEDERKVITSIVRHIENNSGKVGIQQIANENYVSTAFIMKLCKRLGFDGYSELFYNLAQHTGETTNEPRQGSLESLIDQYDDTKAQAFCDILQKNRQRKIYAVGAGFGDLVADYIVQRLAVCGFMAFNRVHFYDYMLFRENTKGRMASNVEPSFIIAISQSGESEAVIKNVELARKKGFQVISFSRRPYSTLCNLSDLSFIIDASKQTLIGGVPNPFFGKVILAFEELMGEYFR